MTNHPFSTLVLNSLHTFLHFLSVKQSTENSVTMANCYPNSYLPFQSNSLYVNIKKKVKMRNQYPGSQLPNLLFTKTGNFSKLAAHERIGVAKGD